jgi:hypothetical protein
MQQVKPVVGLHAALLLRFGRWLGPLAAEHPPIPVSQDADQAVACQHALIQVNQNPKTGDTAVDNEGERRIRPRGWHPSDSEPSPAPAREFPYYDLIAARQTDTHF